MKARRLLYAVATAIHVCLAMWLLMWHAMHHVSHSAPTVPEAQAQEALEGPIGMSTGDVVMSVSSLAGKVYVVTGKYSNDENKDEFSTRGGSAVPEAGYGDGLYVVVKDPNGGTVPLKVVDGYSTDEDDEDDVNAVESTAESAAESTPDKDDDSPAQVNPADNAFELKAHDHAIEIKAHAGSIVNNSQESQHAELLRRQHLPEHEANETSASNSSHDRHHDDGTVVSNRHSHWYLEKTGVSNTSAHHNEHGTSVSNDSPHYHHHHHHRYHRSIPIPTNSTVTSSSSSSPNATDINVLSLPAPPATNFTTDQNTMAAGSPRSPAAERQEEEREYLTGELQKAASVMAIAGVCIISIFIVLPIAFALVFRLSGVTVKFRGCCGERKIRNIGEEESQVGIALGGIGGGAGRDIFGFGRRY